MAEKRDEAQFIQDNQVVLERTAQVEGEDDAQDAEDNRIGTDQPYDTWLGRAFVDIIGPTHRTPGLSSILSCIHVALDFVDVAPEARLDAHSGESDRYSRSWPAWRKVINAQYCPVNLSEAKGLLPD